MRLKPFALPALCTFVCASSLVFAQPNSDSPLAPPANGPRRADPTWIALTDCTVHTTPTDTLYRAVVVFKDGFIQAVIPGDIGKDQKPNTDDDVPARAPIGPANFKATNLHVYPAFIDAFVEVDAPAPPVRVEGRAATGSHWNSAVTPQRNVLDGAGIDEGTAKSLRDMGFAAACISPKGGIFRGRSAVVSLAKPNAIASADKPPVYQEDSYQTISLDTSNVGYPDSQMGAIALMRQTFSDALWQFGSESNQNKGPKASNGQTRDDEVASCLEYLGYSKMANKWLAFDASDELEELRAHKVWKEYQDQGGQSKGMLMVGNGNEYMRLSAIKEDAHPFILPLNFIKAPDVSSPGKAEAVELRDMMRWEQAPTNPRRMAQAGIEFALTSSKLKDRGQFLPNLRKAIQHGLRPEQALASLTTVPAKLLSLDHQLGTIAQGKRANVLLTTGDVFDKKTKFRAIFVDGTLHELEKEKVDLSGTWVTNLNKDGATRSMQIDADGTVTVIKVTPPVSPAPADPAKPDATEAKEKTVKAKARKVAQDSNTLTYIFDHDDFGDDGIASVAMIFDLSTTPPTATGRVVLPDNSTIQYTAVREPRSLAGDWPMFFDVPDVAHQVGGILKAKDTGKGADKKTTLDIFMTTDDGKQQTVAARDVTWDGEKLSYKLLSSDMGGQYPDVTINAKVDWSKTPPVLAGAVTNSTGSFPFTARKIDDAEKWWLGTWIVVRVDGKPEPTPKEDPNDDKVRLEFSKDKLVVVFSKPGKDDVRIDAEDLKIDEKTGTITFTHDLKPIGGEGQSTDTITRFNGELRGVSTLPDGSKHEYAARIEVKEAEEEDETPKDIPENLGTPFGPYALDATPTQDTVVISNVTVWTNDDSRGTEDALENPPSGLPSAGILKNATVVFSGGIIKIVAGSDTENRFRVGADAIMIDGTGKHLTAGVIDCHSHTGISKGVNEGGQAVTSEVRIQDVTNPDSIDWYRQLAAGVTAVNQLHGSANAIGGQSQTTKVRWGVARPEQMHLEGATPGIKFALGENPKQVNWGAATARYPQTRMGVEMLIRDRVTAAKEYAAAKATDHPPRKDLELEALAEILAGKRLVHCHSYRQDEIVMLSQVARDFGFKIGTYQHILEGYKVADYVRDYSGGGSGFSDWWAYKIEVQDAIPAGLPLMSKVGVTTSFNSDSNNLARFLNVEAGKAIKYGREVGGISESEAWKFVTLNPAKQLKIDNRVGMVKEGYDADLVLWSGFPMSTFARVEKTWVDGRELYSQEQDAKHRAKIDSERKRLINKLLKEEKKGKKADAKPEAKSDSPSGPPEGRRRRRPEDGDTKSDDLTNEQRQQLYDLYMQQYMSGRDPRYMPGVCGCGFHSWE
ncbi:MAG: amidohydrolase family protein [Phycisphaerales bacterium]